MVYVIFGLSDHNIIRIRFRVKDIRYYINIVVMRTVCLENCTYHFTSDRLVFTILWTTQIIYDILPKL